MTMRSESEENLDPEDWEEIRFRLQGDKIIGSWEGSQEELPEHQLTLHLSSVSRLQQPARAVPFPEQRTVQTYRNMHIPRRCI